MKKILNKKLIWDILLGMALIIYSFTFNTYYYIHIKWIGLIVAILAFSGIIIYKNVKVDIKFLLLFEAFLLVAVHNSKTDIYYDVAFAWMLPLTYLIGKICVGDGKKYVDKRINIFYFILAIGMMTGGFLDLIYGYQIGFFDTEYMINIWSKGQYVRTTHEYCYILMIAAFYYGIIVLKSGRKAALLLLLADIVIVFEMIRHEGRYSLFYIILQIPLLLIIKIISNKDKQVVIRTLIKVGAIFLLFVVLAITIYNYNIFGITEWYKHSFLSGSGGIIHNVRFLSMAKIIKSLPSYPFGGYDEVTELGSHNMWLKYGNKYGVVVLGLLLIYKLLTIKDMIVLATRRDRGYIKYLLVSTFVYINIYYSMEPNAASAREYYLVGLFINGLISGKIESENK